jgi:hypothetical protein
MLAETVIEPTFIVGLIGGILALVAAGFALVRRLNAPKSAAQDAAVREDAATRVAIRSLEQAEAADAAERYIEHIDEVRIDAEAPVETQSSTNADWINRQR